MTQDYGVISPSAPAGLLPMTGGGSMGTLSQWLAWQTQGYTGIYLDPRYIWTPSGPYHGISNWIVESRMNGSIGWTGNVIAPSTGYINCGTSADGLLIYANAPSEATQGVTFRYCSFIGTNTDATFHSAGGCRKLVLEQCFISNLSTTSASYGLIDDTGSTVNTEDNVFNNCSVSGGWASTGIGINVNTGNANDTYWGNLTTAGGTYGVVINNGSGHTFVNWYDRSSPSTATLWMTSTLAVTQNVTLSYGESHNITGVSYLVAGGTLRLHRSDTVGATTLSGGCINLEELGPTSNTTVTCTGGTYNIGLLGDGGRLTFTGSVGTVNYNLSSPYGPPNVASFTGTYNSNGPVVVASSNGAGYVAAASQAITAATNVGTAITASIASTTNVVAGQYVTVAGASGGTWASINGTWLITGIVLNTSVEFTVGTAPTGSYSASSATAVGGVAYLSYIPPSLVGTYRATFYARVTTAGTSTIPGISYQNDGGTNTAGAPIMWKPGTVAGVTSIVSQGNYVGRHDGFTTDASGTPITFILTPIGSTYSWAFVLERMA